MEVREYFLRTFFKAHEGDVRSLTTLKNFKWGFFSGSRDMTIKLWTPGTKNTFGNTACMTGPEHFISSLCCTPSSDEHPGGLLLAGSNDCAIHVFSLKSYKSIYKLEGHSGTVTALAAGTYGTIISGSWDKTARIWAGKKSVMTLSGHQQAVWAVALFSDRGLMLTGSADKTIRLWRGGKIENVFEGHEDCVRAISIISSSQFLSCSNDCTIRQWNINGKCLAVYLGHTDYVYDICCFNENGNFASCGEDSTLKIWELGTCIATKVLPDPCLWSVTVLESGDVVVGGSRGYIYIFTPHADMKASEKVLSEFEAKLAEFKSGKDKKREKPSLGILENYEFPGLDALNNPGIIKGQKIFCRDGEDYYSFEWDDTDKVWRDDSDINKVYYPGTSKSDGAFKNPKIYDNVLKIEIDDSMLTLSFNNDENPWNVAQDFINKHNIPQIYMNQIVDYILVNSNIKNATANNFDNAYSDPFTGTDRYIPGLVTEPEKPLEIVVTEIKSENTKIDIPPNFPYKRFITFNLCNIIGLEKKLNEFSDCVGEDFKVSPSEIKSLLELIDYPSEVTSQQLEILQKIMSWPVDYVFPALDVFRLSIRSPLIIGKIKEAGENIIYNYIMKHLVLKTNDANIMLIIRILCNMFEHEFGLDLVFHHAEQICAEASTCVPTTSKLVEVSLATLYLNYAVALNKLLLSKDIVVHQVSLAFKKFKDQEALFRLMICIGTLMDDSSVKVIFKCANIEQFLKEYLESPELPSKNEKCAKKLLRMFK